MLGWRIAGVNTRSDIQAIWLAQKRALFILPIEAKDRRVAAIVAAACSLVIVVIGAAIFIIFVPRDHLRVFRTQRIVFHFRLVGTNAWRAVLQWLILASAAIAVAPSLARAGETVLYSSQGGTKDGADPDGGLLFDVAGALYGTTEEGGGLRSGMGTVFKLSPPAAGKTQWAETVLYSFKGPPQHDGAFPNAGLIIDKQGALYGTTFFGGTIGYGTVFKLTPPAAGQSQWTETLLHSLAGKPNDGAQIRAGVIFDNAGALYGTTEAGGASGNGTVFQVTGAAPAAAVPQAEEQQ